MSGSAGVGRTGSFIVVDAILDGLRREQNLPPASALTDDGDAQQARPISSRHSSGESVTKSAAAPERSAGLPTPIPEESELESKPSKPMSLSHANMYDHQRQSFMQHRGDVDASPSAPSSGDRRPSVSNSYSSSERLAFVKTMSDQATNL
jgi:hypothetical protein